MPRNPDGSHTYSTIGDYLDDPEYTISVHCEGRTDAGWCHHRANLDLEKVAAKLGRDHSCLAPALKPHFRCSKCGSKDISFRISHSGRPSR